MGIWLYETGDRVAHYYPDDDEQTKAACGNILCEECHACGQTLHVDRPQRDMKNCGECTRIVAAHDTSPKETP